MKTPVYNSLMFHWKHYWNTKTMKHQNYLCWTLQGRKNMHDNFFNIDLNVLANAKGKKSFFNKDRQQKTAFTGAGKIVFIRVWVE